jgi:demethylmenaquinone methyltransferase/2-methoxy-6-polyprenyl-1,4-benzoquinol methylase
VPLSRSGRLFDRLARRYDLGNRIVSLGQDLRWKRRAAARLGVQPEGIYLDVGAGTGDLARLLAAAPGARVLAVDASRAMLLAGRLPPQASALVADAQALPVRDGVADGIASGFLLRNLPDLDAFLAAAARALRPGGRLVLLEICLPKGRLRRGLFRLHFHGVAPLLGGLATGQWSAYRYLSRSLRGFPPPERLAEMAAGHGLATVALERSEWLGLFLLTLERRPAPAHVR